MNTSGVETLEATKVAVLEMKESVTGDVLAMCEDVVDEQTQDVVISALADMTAGLGCL